jgi:LPXTG-motif cell wall-anchored protein
MLDLAFVILCAAVLIGSGLAIAYMRGPQAKPLHRIVPLVHGILGAASLGVLITALRRGLPQTGMGTSGFGVIAAGLLGLALMLGLALGLAWRRRRPPGALIGVHASLAIAGFVVLLTLIALSSGRPL